MIRKKFFGTLTKSLTLSAFVVALVSSPSRGDSDPQGFSTSRTAFKFCNKSAKVIFAAYAFPFSGGWASRGWTSMKPGQCSKYIVVSGIHRDVFVYAESNDGVRWYGNDGSFCVHETDDFSYSNSDKRSCNAAGQKRVSMTKWSASRNTYNFLR